MEKCSICRQSPNPDCNWNQGRCPHRLTPLANFEFNEFKRALFLVALIVCVLNIFVSWNTSGLYGWVAASVGWFVAFYSSWKE